jgi:20S proteasome alpha/beta subunit
MTTRRKYALVKPVKQRRKTRVTVCIASIYNNNSLLGASDKMLTNYDVEFEPSDRAAKKTFPVTKNIVVMTAGGSSIHAHLLPKLQDFVNKRLEEDSSALLPVVDVANNYQKQYIEYRRGVAENQFLAPLGLNLETFTAIQQTMNQQLVLNIASGLVDFKIDYNEDIEAIIAGIDETGPHLYVLQSDNLICNDNVGFAAIGSGANHAISQLELSGLSRHSPEVKTLVAVHRAKKKSEISHGVGRATDMFVIGPRPNSLNWLEPTDKIKTDIVSDMDGFYQRYLSSIARLDQREQAKIQEYLDKFAQDAKATLDQATNDEGANVPLPLQ